MPGVTGAASRTACHWWRKARHEARRNFSKIGFARQLPTGRAMCRRTGESSKGRRRATLPRKDSRKRLPLIAARGHSNHASACEATSRFLRIAGISTMTIVMTARSPRRRRHCSEPGEEHHRVAVRDDERPHVRVPVSSDGADIESERRPAPARDQSCANK